MKKVTTRNARGAALVIVLAFLAILSVIVVAYLSGTSTDRQLAHGTFSENRAEILARAALDTVVGDFKQEIANGSSASTTSGYTIYTPSTHANMLPVASGTPSDKSIPNLIRCSVRNDTPTAPAVGSRGSIVNSATDVSLNSRSISLARWNKHYLIPRLNAGSTAADSTPIASFTAIAPDWVLVTRNGPAAFTSWNTAVADSTSTNTSFVVGRYAYTVYDEGGLIDANVAGYPSPAPSPSNYIQTVGRKGSAAYADLTSLPTSTATPAATFPPTQVNNIVGWRNYASTRPTGDLTTNFTFNATSAQSFMTLIANNTGFMAVAPSPTPSIGATDQAFTSRQQLLAFRTQTGSSQNALQFLGTFVRELNRPSYKPAAISATNPDLQSVRVQSVFARADGTQATIGEPLLKDRFALTRINELLNTSNANIKRDFGLAWDATNNHWNYVGNGSTTLAAIEILSQVAAENREPNFFEVLKAVIGSGSIGLGTTGNTFVAVEAKYASVDYQVMQIGANTIDAWDLDNVPTFINLGGNELAGVENLPYLNKLVFSFFFTNNGHGDLFSSWIVPSLWNPHQNAGFASGDVRFAMTSGSIAAAAVNTPTVFTTPYLNGSTGAPYFQVHASSFVAASPPMPSPSPANEITKTDPATTPQTSGTYAYDGLYLGTYSDPSGVDWKNVDQVYPVFAADGAGNLPTFEMQVGIANGAPASPPAPAPSPSPTPPHPAPYITNQPGDQVVTIGSPAAFSVTAGPTPPASLTYQWKKNGNPISLATSASYTTLATTAADNGSFFAVVVTNGANGSVTSISARLTVLPVGSVVWKAYQRWKGAQPSPLVICQGINKAKWKDKGGYKDPKFVTLDPRTIRFGVWGAAANDTGNNYDYQDGAQDTMDENGQMEPISTMKPLPVGTFPTTGKIYLYATNTTNGDQYADPDTVKRRGDWTTSTTGTATKTTVMFASPTPSPSPVPAATPTNSQDRPRILSSPFQSVAELGTVFRDQPWKTLNFSTTNSADAGLLDAFTLQDSSMVAGRTSLNTRQSAVLTAIITQATKNLAAGQAVGSTGANTSVTLVSADIAQIVSRISALTTASPMINKSELVTKLMEDATLNTNVWSKLSTNPYNKETRESVLRALCDSTQTRTWNLMIDVIAQSGRYPSSATSLANFLVEGEKRYWLHVAIDRFTGEIIDQQLEAVYE